MTTGREYRAFFVAAAWIVSTVLCGGAGAATRLELKLDKGKTWYDRSLIDQTITQDIMGQQQVINMTIGIAEKLEVLGVDGQGNMQIRHTYTWTRFKQAIPMAAPVDYDSSQQTTPPAGAEGFAALIGQSYTIKVSPQGKVLEITGMEQLSEAVRQKAPAADPSQGPDALSAFIDKGAVKEMTENSMAVYPDKPVEPGDSWTRTQLTSRGFAMITDSKWTLQKQEGGVATIATAGSVKVDPNGAPMQTQGMAMKMDLSGTQEGTIQMDEATGLIRSNRGHQQLKGQINVGASPEGPFNMMSIPMTIDTTFTIETSDKMWETKPQ
jgi:hypothetical protein